MPRVNISPSQLLVEGKDDEHVCYSLFEHYQLPDKFCKVVDSGGFERLKYTLPRRLKESELKHLGIIVDADTDLASRWQSLQDVLTGAGYLNVPNLPDPQGTVIEQASKPKVGIWIMPDNSLPGMLENFISFLVPDPQNNQLWQLAEKCLQEATLVSPTLPQAKGKIHTYLAWQDDPGTPLGLAITKKFLDANSPYAGQFVDWIRRLFEL